MAMKAETALVLAKNEIDKKISEAEMKQIGLDSTLTDENKAAPAKITGDKINELNSNLGNITNVTNDMLGCYRFCYSGESNDITFNCENLEPGLYIIFSDSNYFIIGLLNVGSNYDGYRLLIADGNGEVLSLYENSKSNYVTFNSGSWYTFVYIKRLSTFVE